MLSSKKLSGENFFLTKENDQLLDSKQICESVYGIPC